MSDTEDTQTGEVGSKAFFRWTSDDARATFREELAEVRTTEVTLKEVYVETPETGGAPQLIRVTFDVEAQEYLRLEERNWFGLKPGLAAGMGFQFAPDRPVQIVAHLDADSMESLILPDLDPEGPGEAMKDLIEPLFDADSFGIESPLAYEYEQVTQLGDEGAVGFSADGVRVQEESEGEILPPVSSAGSGSQVQGDMEGVEYFETEETLESLTAAVDEPANFSGKQEIRGRLKSVEVLLGAEGPQRLCLVVDFDHATYSAIEKAAIFGLTAASRSATTGGPFDENLPVEMTLALKPDLLVKYFSESDIDWEEAIGVLAGALADPECADPLKAIDAYVYESAMQQPPGQNFFFGFNNKDEVD